MLSFEYPILSTAYAANVQSSPAASVGQTWTWMPSSSGGLANQVASGYAPSSGAAQDGIQFAYLQNSATVQSVYMQSYVTQLVPCTSYIVTFYWNTAAGAATTSQLSVLVDGVLVYQSAAGLSGGSVWQLASSGTFTSSGVSSLVVWANSSSSTGSSTVLLDKLTITTAAAATATLDAYYGASFEYPTLTGAATIYQYQTAGQLALSAAQPWTFSSPTNGGIALTGSPFDPPPPIAPPNGQQYAFIQTSPKSKANQRTEYMQATVSGLVPGAAYQTNFYWAVRYLADKFDTVSGGVGNQTQCNVTLLIDNTVVWASGPAVSDAAGWFEQTSVSWTAQPANSGTAAIAFVVQSTSDDDHTITFDQVTFARVPPEASLTPFGANGFEYPNVATAYSYNSQSSPAISATQSWTWMPSSSGGLANQVASGYAPSSGAAQDGIQFAYLQNSATVQSVYMQSYVTQLVPCTSYIVTFYWNTAAGAATTSQLSVLVDGVLVYQSAAGLSGGSVWQLASSGTFTSSGVSSLVVWANSSSSTGSSTVLLDKLTITTAAAATATLDAYYGASFEYPTLTGAATIYQYQTAGQLALSAAQPWTFSSPTNGGIALTGSPFDPPPPIAPPNGQQYAFIQTSPKSKANQRTEYMQATVSGLVPGAAYQTNFYWAVRYLADKFDTVSGGVGNQTQSTVMVLIEGSLVWTSPPDASDAAGWFAATSIQWQAQQTQGGLTNITLMVSSDSDDDHSVLFDQVTFIQVVPGSDNTTLWSPAETAASTASSHQSAGSSASMATAATAQTSATSAVSAVTAVHPNSAATAATASSAPTAAQSCSAASSSSSVEYLLWDESSSGWDGSESNVASQASSGLRSLISATLTVAILLLAVN